MTRVMFMGTAELAVASLRALLVQPQLQVVGVITQPDRPQGRKLQLKPSPVKAAAVDAGLTVMQPEKVRTEAALAEIRALEPELIVVVAYGQLLPKSLLEIPKHACLNVHTSLLPKHRGAAPIQWAIINGDSLTGVTLMQMDPGLDTGPILAQTTTPITADDTAQTLHDRLAVLGSELLVQSIPGWLSGSIIAKPQPSEGSSYARKIQKTDGLLDWNLPAVHLWNRVRGSVPWPGAYFHHPAGTPSILKVWEARALPCPAGPVGEVVRSDAEGIVVRCGQGALSLQVLQREGGKRLPAREFLMGYPIKAGERCR